MSTLNSTKHDHPLPGSDPYLVFLSRARLREEVSQALYDLMMQQGISRSEFARRAGKKRPYITRVLSGDHNFELDTLSDLFLVLGRYPHLVLGTDPNETRLAVDEGSDETTTTFSIAVSDGDEETTDGPKFKDSEEASGGFRTISRSVSRAVIFGTQQDAFDPWHETRPAKCVL